MPTLLPVLLYMYVPWKHVHSGSWAPHTPPQHKAGSQWPPGWVWTVPTETQLRAETVEGQTQVQWNGERIMVLCDQAKFRQQLLHQCRSVESLDSNCMHYLWYISGVICTGRTIFTFHFSAGAHADNDERLAHTLPFIFTFYNMPTQDSILCTITHKINERHYKGILYWLHTCSEHHMDGDTYQWQSS